MLILGTLFVMGGLLALIGKPSKAPQGSWVHLIYEEHKEKLLKRS